VQTTTHEIADGIHRISTFVPDAGLTFNQILVTADEPLLFHTGMRALFPLVSEAVGRVIPVERLRWIGFGHVEADECGAMNDWLAAAPHAEVAFGSLGVMVSVADLADRPPRGLDDGEVLDLGGKRLRYLATPHVPHGWDAGLFFEETTGTLLAGDLCTQLGDVAAVTDDSPVDGAVTAEEAFGYSCLGPTTVPTFDRLADLEPTTLALMHGPAHTGPAGTWLREMGAYYGDRKATLATAP
jgi:flavorubredoxin